MENEADRARSRSERKSRPKLRREEYAAHVCHQSRGQNCLRRRDRQQSHAESFRYFQLDELRESRARRIARRQNRLEREYQAVRLLGEVQVTRTSFFCSRSPRRPPPVA